ncbi:MAG: peptidoglycan DD-metalloendopeptidase family protein, partial [Clostridiales bacterium]|nr:peptidoglycan DD-metalloendopeptidase family protein [Clostridiales bacterium]
FSGVVVRNFQLTEADGVMGKGITISGEPGQIVKAIAAGKVVAIARQEDVFAVEIHHTLGYVSIYSGFGELWVARGDQLEAGDEIGTVSQASLDFYLWKDGQEIDPLEYLFDSI